MIIRISFLVLFCSFLFVSVEAQDVQDRVVVRVLSFNILHGATMDGNFDLDVIAKVIIDAKPDFVALQEVDFKTNRAHELDLVTELGYRTNMSPLFARAMYYDDGEYGEGLLTKYSFISTRNISLPYSHGNEPRAAVEGIVELPSGDTIAIVGTHLDHLKEEKDRISQAEKINEVWSSTRYPAILAGDLNAEPGSETINMLESQWVPSYDSIAPQFTYSSMRPQKKIDYIMHRPKGKWKVLQTEVICDTLASDHCAYLVELELIR